MSFRNRRTTASLMLACLVHSTLAPPVAADHFFGRVVRLVEEKEYNGTPPEMCEDTAIEELAENIDWLEHHIDRYGSVVAKQPDIWGEARLTKHRDEFERMLYQELNQFQFTLNAAIRQSDSSFAAAALALSAAATSPADDAGGADAAATSTVVQPLPVATTQELANMIQPSGDNPFDEALELGRYGADKLSIEPTVYLDQLSRYVNHLHELRRINEGDDTSDSPGYALNLIRLPVSILPGKLTREGWGAEITVTATPVLSDDLLPTTFRNLVINDLVDQLRLPLVKMVEEKAWQYPSRVEVETKRREVLRIEQQLNTIKSQKQDLSRTKADLSRQIADIKRILQIQESALAQASTAYKTIAAAAATVPDAAADPADGNAAIANRAAGVSEAAIRGIADNLQEAGLQEQFLRQASLSMPELFSTVSASDAPSTSTAPPALDLDTVLNSAFSQGADIEQIVQDVTKSINEKASEDEEELRQQLLYLTASQERVANQISALQSRYQELQPQLQSQQEMLDKLEKKGLDRWSSGLAGPTSRARRARHPLAPSVAIGVLDFHSLKVAARQFCLGYRGRYVRWAGYPDCDEKNSTKETRVNILDAERWLHPEIEAAYELLSDRTVLPLWHRFAHPTSGLATAIRTHQLNPDDPQAAAPVVNLRNDFFGLLQESQSPTDGNLGADPVPPQVVLPGEIDDYMVPAPPAERHARSTTEALAWAIIVETALLNDRLNDDMRKTAVARGCHCLPVGEQDLTFFLPASAAAADSPFAEEFFAATKAFQEYVKCRWPIHVFALDPREQDQNVADFSARRRELQLALSMGFVSGEISANTLMNYSRQLDTEVETISLNRTIASFGHGNDTFGWRFYPRVQALDQPGALGATWQSIRGTPRDHDVRKRHLEPGMRECVAVVIMPSFVPYADFDVRTNWFRLTNPKNAALTMRDSVKLSKAITAMRRSRAQCARCAHCYRPGEVDRLMKRVHQLDRELPLQTMRSQIPYENTLGGFEMFNTGVTDLAPELVGWYGAPGVVIASGTANYACGCYADCQYCKDGTGAVIACQRNAAGPGSLPVAGAGRDKAQPFPVCEGEGTTLFLVGDNFSVHDTKVIAGGVCIPHVRLVSREIMRVTIPSCVNTVNVAGKDYVAVYAATPYGVTNHLHVPVHARKLDEPTKTQIQTAVEAAVKTTVKAEIAGLRLAPLDMEVKFPKDSKIELAGQCFAGDPARVNIELKPGADWPHATVDVKNPALKDPTINAGPVLAKFFVAVKYKGKFHGGMIDVGTIDLKAVQPVVVIGDDKKEEIIQRLESTVPKSELLDKKETVALVYYVQLLCQQCQAAATQLTDELTIEIAAPCACCKTSPAPEAAESEPATTDSPAAAPSTSPQSEPVLGIPEPELPAPTSTPAPVPADACNCATTTLTVR
ncbi:MAG: hypothetical protein CMJ58_20100 [Planctomycetaceae bacterium]|nr:hypothetical protein [Planctomycetaceae bacterium]